MAALTCLQIAGVSIITIILSLILFLVLLKIYILIQGRAQPSPAKMNGKVVIVTGANSGIGKETARELAKRGAKVIMACRNLETANKVRDEIVKETNNQSVVVKKLDLSSLQSVRTFAADINKTENKLDVLIHNAGVAYTFEKVVTKDGLDGTMATNHFGPFLLTHLLIDLLKRSAPARIVIVASELYKFAACGFNINKINPVGFFFPGYLYYYSKYVNVLFALELARKLENTGITVNCLHPGMIDSGIWRNVPFPLNLFLLPLTKGIFKTPEEGCRTTVHCAVSPELQKVTGRYFMDCKVRDLAPYIMDQAIAKKAWELSEPLVKLEASDPRI